MPSLDTITPDKIPIKLLLMGHSGTGKTGSLASLAAAGYRVFLADFENGFHILLDEKVLPKQHRKNVYIKTFYDKRQGPKAIPVGGVPKAMLDFYDMLSTGWKETTTANGKTQTISLGTPYTWGDNDVLVIDSVTALSESIEQHVLHLNNRLGSNMQIQDYNTCQEILHGLFQSLCSPATTCHVIFICHLRQLDDGTGFSKWFPQATGRKISPLIPRYFNNTVLVKRDAKGNRLFYTQSTHDADMKVSKPSLVPPEMPADLATLFKLLRAEG